MDLYDLDLALRGGTIGVLLLLSVLLWLSRIAREAQIIFSGLWLVLAARLCSTVPDTSGFDDTTLLVLRLVSCWGAFFITYFILVIYLDERRFGWIWLVSAALISIAIPATRIWPEATFVLRIYAALHFLSLLSLVLISGRDDLQDARRRLRPGMSAFLLLYSLGQAFFGQPMQDSRALEGAVTQSSVTFAFALIFALWALKPNLANWPAGTTPRPASEPTPVQQHAEQTRLIAKITAEMDAGIWQTEGLTVGGLAQQVAAPEHQVRRAINQELGHRNFASFINAARIEAAKTRLQDPEAERVTILEIAYDVGFSSLGPFNRAFRASTGLSPTDFRKAALTQG